jgi:hypothetical protein
VVGMADAPVTALTLRERLADLLEGNLSLEDFDEWFALNTWEDNNVSPDARHLASRIQLVLAEFTSGHWTWPEVQDELTRLAQRMEVVWGGAPIRTTGVTVSEVIRGALPEDLSGAGSIQYAEVCV